MSSPENTKPALNYLVRRPKIVTQNPPLLILLHGVGGNEENLFSFADQLPDKYLVVSVRGPCTLAAHSYAWFQVDFSSGRPVIAKEQAESSRKAIIQFIDNLIHVEQFDYRRIVLMGFSQGGIMSYSVALTTPDKIQGIAVMSGRLLPEIKPFIAPADQLKKLHLFISHGLNDRTLEYQYALDAESYLKSLGLSPELRSYNDVHLINQQMLADFKEWLKSLP